MVARINTGKNISRTLNYNEQKVHAGTAEILSASGFIKEAPEMNFYEKLERFQSLIELNERTETNSLHVSLNFDPSENIPNEKMNAIADTYMQKIGFADQPYLVYRHYDSGHPHIHIVSINIQRDGSRISMHNMGRNQSEKARKEIEQDFGLVKADSKKLAEGTKLVPVNAQKVIYGKTATRHAISNVLLQVIDKYKYSSLAELNAVLKLYNVFADPGKKGSVRFQQKGLVNYGLSYRVLDENGNKIGAPIKASAFFMKPTRANLEMKFIVNENLKAPYKKRLTTAIDWALLSKPTNIKELIALLEKENISLVLRENKDGVIYGLTYIDHKTKTVFNGSDLGKAYSANAIQEKTKPVITLQPEHSAETNQSEKQLPGRGKKNKQGKKTNNKEQHNKQKQMYPLQQSANILNGIPINAGQQPLTDNSAPFEPPKKKKKKRRRIKL